MIGITLSMKPVFRHIMMAACLGLAACRPVAFDPDAYIDESFSEPATLRISGSYALLPLVRQSVEDIRQLYPGMDISLIPAGSGSAIRDLEMGRSDLALSSRQLTEKEERSGLQGIALARTGVVFIFNGQCPYRKELLESGLTISSLRKLYTSRGTVTWDELLFMKATVPVNAYHRSDSAGAAEVAARFLYLEPGEMQGKGVNGEYQMIEAVRQDIHGIGYANINDVFDLATGERLPGIDFLPVDLNDNRRIEQREEICSKLSDFQTSVCNYSYPYLLTRNLFIVYRKKDLDRVEKAFILWILEKERENVDRLGYSKISESLEDYNLFILNKK
jgi:phosphate transport system substrate-binding protein